MAAWDMNSPIQRFLQEIADLPVFDGVLSWIALTFRIETVSVLTLTKKKPPDIKESTQCAVLFESGLLSGCRL